MKIIHIDEKVNKSVALFPYLPKPTFNDCLYFGTLKKDDISIILWRNGCCTTLTSSTDKKYDNLHLPVVNIELILFYLENMDLTNRENAFSFLNNKDLEYPSVNFKY